MDEKRERESMALWVRDNMPTCAGVAAAFAAEFAGTRMVYASENGHVIGKPGQDGIKLTEVVIGRMFPDVEGRRR